MNITVLAVGTKMPRWVDEAVGEYAKRFGREIQFNLEEIKPEKRGSGVSVAQGMAAEEQRIVDALPERTVLVVLDERGTAPTSVQLADGITDALKNRANLLLRLSSLTLPHAMVRVLLTEQLYRAASILNNHPYHRE